MTTDPPLDLTALRRATDALELSLELLDRHRGSVEERRLLRDGVIQRFEFAFEMAWKTLHRYLRVFGLVPVANLTNRDLFRLGHEQGLLEVPEAWFTFLRHRNLTSHVYDEATAERVFSSAAPLLAALRDMIEAMEARLP